MSLLEITGLTHSFGDNYLFKDAELALNKGEHIGVVGQNGAGKSTLIKICTEQIIPDAGRVVWQPKVTVGKVVISGFNGIGKSTLLNTLTGHLIPLGGEFYFSNQAVVGYFEQDLKWENDMQTPIQILSDAYPSLAVKEVRKHLARCGISNKHAMQTISTLSGGEQAKEALKAALSEFEGTILLVSHEEAFYRNWTNKVIHIDKI